MSFRRLAFHIHLRAYKDSEIWETRRKLLPQRSSKNTSGRCIRRELETNAKRKRSTYSHKYAVYAIEKALQQDEIDLEMFRNFNTVERWNPSDGN